MANYFNRNYFDFFWVMTVKEVKARYKRAAFGFLWIILNPLFQMLIIGVVFSYFINIQNYFLFLFPSLLAWQFFSLSMSKATPSIVNERSLLHKSKFPIETIPISVILANFVNTLISFLLYFIFLVVFERGGVVGGLWVILGLIWLMFFTIGLSLSTSALQVRYRDVSFFVQSALILWFYVTPVIYNIGIIPEKLHFIYYINPLSFAFELIHSQTTEVTISSDLFLVNFSTSSIITILGVIVFYKNKKYFVDWL